MVSSWGARWVKDIKDNHIPFNKQLIKDAVADLLFNCCFTAGPNIFCQIICIPVGSDSAPFFSNIFLYFYQSKWMNEIKKNDLMKAWKSCNTFRFIDEVNSINNSGEFETNCSNTYLKELMLHVKKILANIEAFFWI